VRRSFASSDGGGAHRSTRIGARGRKRVRIRSRIAFYRGREAAGRADGRRPGSFGLRALNQRAGRRSWRSGDAARSVERRTEGLPARGGDPGVGAVERQGTSEVVVGGSGSPSRRAQGVCSRRRGSARAPRVELRSPVGPKLPRRKTVAPRGGITAARTVGPAHEELTQHADAARRPKRRGGWLTPAERSRERSATGRFRRARRNEPAKGESGNRPRPSP
jgi:hypothetical protein